MHYPCARLFPALAIRSLPVPTDPASARESSLAHMPQAPRTRFSLTLPSRYALLSSAYPFSACPNRQPFVLGLRKGTPTYFLFPHFLIIAHDDFALALWHRIGNCSKYHVVTNYHLNGSSRHRNSLTVSKRAFFSPQAVPRG